MLFCPWATFWTNDYRLSETTNKVGSFLWSADKTALITVGNLIFASYIQITLKSTQYCFQRDQVQREVFPEVEHEAHL